MNEHPIEPALKEARAAARHGRDTRLYHAKRTKKGSEQREEDLSAARERIKLAMIPLRAFQGTKVYLAPTKANDDLIDRVEKASAALQSERRKLWKMQDRSLPAQEEETPPV